MAPPFHFISNLRRNRCPANATRFTAVFRNRLAKPWLPSDRPIRKDHEMIDKIELQFREFHQDNPEVYYRLRQLARAWKNNISDKVGIATIYEQLRWQLAMEKRADGYKLNNNYAALYARLLMENEPDLRGLFNLRERTTKRFGETR